MKRTFLEEGSKVKINLNYLKEFLSPGDFESEQQFNSIGTVTKIYLIENIDFYEVLWDDKDNPEPGFNREFLTEIHDVNGLMKELL